MTPPSRCGPTSAPDTEVRQLDEVSMLIHGPADSTTLGRVSRWCEAQADGEPQPHAAARLT